MTEPTFKERLQAALAKIDQSMPMPARPKRLGGVLFIHPSCMENEDGMNTALTEAIVPVLRHMFTMLGHNISVFVTYANETKVIARSREIEESQDIQHLTNLAFRAFFDAQYNTDRALTLLENRNIIPRWTPD